MSRLFSRALVAAYSEATCSDGGQSVPVITIERRQAFGTGGDGALRLCIDGVPILGQIGYSLSNEVDGPTLYECKLIVDGRKIRLVE